MSSQCAGNAVSGGFPAIYWSANCCTSVEAGLTCLHAERIGRSSGEFDTFPRMASARINNEFWMGWKRHDVTFRGGDPALP